MKKIGEGWMLIVADTCGGKNNNLLLFRSRKAVDTDILGSEEFVPKRLNKAMNKKYVEVWVKEKI